MARAKFYKISFTVEGDGAFPLDMLRYDRCVPVRGEDVSNIALEKRGKRSVQLHRFSEAGKSEPCMDRWLSFGWRVTEYNFDE